MQKSVKEIRQYLKECFKLYSLWSGEFFYEYDKRDMPIETKIFKNGIIDDAVLEQMEKVFGISKENILSTDKSAQYKWYDKYSYFYHKPLLESAYTRTMYGEGAEEILLFNALFGKNTKDAKIPPRYDLESVKDRLISTLKNLDAVLPGTFHENASIVKLDIYSNQFCSYEDFTEMMNSYLSMFETVENYFFKAKRGELSTEEILEYNFLVTVLGVKDVVCPSKYMYYDVIKKLAPLLESEGYTHFYDYVTFSNNRAFEPWICREFVENKEYIQAYINIYPHKRLDMLQYAMRVSKFECKCQWSDAKPIILDDGDEDCLFDDAIPNVPISERAKEFIFVYVDKTEQELIDDGIYAGKLIHSISCESAGGIVLPSRQINKDISRMISRINLLIGGNKND